MVGSFLRKKKSLFIAVDTHNTNTHQLLLVTQGLELMG